MTSKETIIEVLNRGRAGLALITFEAKCYDPKKKDTSATHMAAATHKCGTESVAVIKNTVIDQRVADIKTILNRARSYHYKMTRSWAGRRVGIIRGPDLMDYIQQMNEFKREFAKAVDAAAAEWPKIIKEQQKRLNGLFRIEDYPTTDEFRSRFHLAYYPSQLPEQTDWRLDVDQETVDDLAGSFEDQMLERLNAMKATVLAETKDMLAHTRKLLGKAEPKGIRAALVTNLRRQAEWLSDLNIDQDGSVRDVVKIIEGQVANESADELRENDLARLLADKAARKALKKIKEAA